MSTSNPKIAIMGFALEANAFSPVSIREDFTRSCWREGAEITELARQTSNLPAEVTGFYARMDVPRYLLMPCLSQIMEHPAPSILTIQKAT